MEQIMLLPESMQENSRNMKCKKHDQKITSIISQATVPELIIMPACPKCIIEEGKRIINVIEYPKQLIRELNPYISNEN